MKNNQKSKFVVIGFVVFVIAIYSGSYFYTKNNNQRLLSSPMLVMLVDDESKVNSALLPLDKEQRREQVLDLYEMGKVFSVSQVKFDQGVTDITEVYKDNVAGKTFVTANCLEYSQLMKRTMEKVAKTNLRATWVFSACGIIE
jgi:hypothetical protein